jgi:acetolactate synthase-1/2/3 large subunit
MDRLPADSPVYAGRPNTWGMRWANLAIQQSDLVLALGTRLGLQQTGFAWQEFAPVARIAQVDIDPSELSKGRPRLDWAVEADANSALASLVDLRPHPAWTRWRAFIGRLRRELPLVEPANLADGPELVPQVFVEQLSALMNGGDVLVPSSSGGAFTVAMQVFENKDGQTIVSNKALASMGYGLAGAIGAALANPSKRIVLTEGDGGFAQNLQELGTVAGHRLNVKMFIMANGGYASIRMTQRNYFGGAYVGCDRETGLGLPNWERLAAAWSVPYRELDRNWATDPTVRTLLETPGPVLFEVPVSEEQPYWPKIGSRILTSGAMASAPLHMMSPALAEPSATQLLPFIPKVEPDEPD